MCKCVRLWQYEGEKRKGYCVFEKSWVNPLHIEVLLLVVMRQELMFSVNTGSYVRTRSKQEN